MDVIDYLYVISIPEYNEESIAYDLQDVLNEVKSVRSVSIQGSRKRYTTELTPFQKKIFELYRLVP